MASASSGMVDVTKPGRFPVVLGDSILNRSNPKELLTGIRYNHKPSLSTPTAPTSARLKPSASSSSSTSSSAQQENAQSFDMNFTDDGGKFLYQGQRTTDPSQVVLIFDPVNQVFVMERVDSVFHMNLAATPTNSDADALRREFPHLEISKSATAVTVDGGAAAGSGSGTTSSAPAPAKKAASGGARKAKDKDKVTATATGKTKAKGTAAEKAVREKKTGKKMKEDKKTAASAASGAGVEGNASSRASGGVDFALPSRPTAESAVPTTKKKLEPDSEEDEDSDDDLGLTVEYPGGKPPQTSFGVSSGMGMGGNTTTAIGTRTFEQLLQGHDDEQPDDDADADADIDFDFEDDGDDRSVVSDAPKLPSPVGQQQQQQQQQYQQYYGQESEEDEDEGDALEDALEAELMNALDEVEQDSEDVSEEE